MIKKFIRFILSKHCPCYKMGYNKHCQFTDQKIGGKK